MSTDSRKTQLEVGADSSDAIRALDGIVSAAQSGAAKVEQAGERMADGIGELPKSSDAAARKLERDTQSMAASIQRATAVAKAGGSGTAAYYQVLSSQRGLDLPTLKPLLDELSAAQAAIPKLNPALKQVSAGLGEGEMSAKAMAAAMRSLPAQVTDIVTSLQGGQRPLTVLFQQGGQIKDMFGGAGNAVSAVGRYLVQLISPASVAAASVALLGAAWLQGSKEAETFNQTLILSGSASGYYTGQLTATARAIRELGSGTQGRATEVLNEMAQSAGVGSENLLRFTDAALRLQRAGGPAAEVTARAFKDLAKAPLEAALKLNQQQNFLTPQVYEQIKALTEQGRTTAAARVAQEAYYDAINGRVPKLEQNLGLLERAWRGVAETAKLAWDGMLDIGRTQDPVKLIQDQIAVLDKRAEYRRPGQAAPENEQRARAKLEERLATAQAEAAAKQKAADADNRQLEATQALKALDDTANQYLPRRIAMERELAQVRENAARALAAPNLYEGTRETILAQQRAAEKGIRDKFDPGITQARAQSEAAAIERQLGIMTSAYSDAQRVMEALHQSGIVSDREYYNARRSFIELDRDASVRGLQAQIDATTEANKSDKLTTAQRIANGDKILDLQAKISQAKGKSATDTILLGMQETAALANVTKAYEQAKQAAQEYLDQLQRGQSRDLSRFNLSDGERQRGQGRDQIEDKYAADRIRIRNEMSQLSIQQNGTLTEQQRKQYADLLQLNQQFEDAALKSYDGYVQQKLGMESDWTNGAQRAWNEYLETVRNVSQQTHDLISNALNGGTDALANYLAAGKYTFNEFGRVVGQVAQQVLAELLKIYIRQQLVGIIGSISGSAASAGAGVNGSAGSAYIPSNVAHGGGVMGAESFTQRVMPASTWSSAPRFHKGMAPDEYAAILQEGEGVFTKEQMRRLGPAGGKGDVNLGVNVNLINQSGQDMKATATKRGDGGIDVLLQAFEQSMAGNVSSGTGPLSRAIQSRFGLRATTSL